MDCAHLWMDLLLSSKENHITVDAGPTMGQRIKTFKLNAAPCRKAGLRVAPGTCATKSVDLKSTLTQNSPNMGKHCTQLIWGSVGCVEGPNCGCCTFLGLWVWWGCWLLHSWCLCLSQIYPPVLLCSNASALSVYSILSRPTIIRHYSVLMLSWVSLF